MNKSTRAILIAAVSLGLLAFFVRGAHLDQVWVEIKEANALMITISLATTVLTMVIRAIRWQYLLAPIGAARFRPAFRTTMIGFAASTVLPARPGEVILGRRKALQIGGSDVLPDVGHECLAPTERLKIEVGDEALDLLAERAAAGGVNEQAAELGHEALGALVGRARHEANQIGMVLAQAMQSP